MIDYRADPEFYQGFLGCAGFPIEPYLTNPPTTSLTFMASNRLLDNNDKLIPLADNKIDGPRFTISLVTLCLYHFLRQVALASSRVLR